MKPHSRRMKLSDYLNQLSDSQNHKTRRREEALQGIVQELTRNLNRDESFLDSNRMSLVDQCLRVIKKTRSVEELATAARAIGLVAMILDDVEAAHEVYRDSALKLFDAVKLTSSKLKVPAQVLQCLAVVTYFGAFVDDDRLGSMEMIWGYFFQDSGHQGKEDHSPELVAAAISSWTFIVSNPNYGVNRTHWQMKIPCLFRLLEHQNESVVIAAAEALALIFEIDPLNNTSMVAENCNDGDGPESSSGFKISIAEKLKEMVLAKNVMNDEEGKERDRTTANTNNRVMLLANYFEEGSYKKFGSIKGMTVTTWLERIQLTFLEEFLGKERCAEHIKVNKKLQGMFKLKTMKRLVVEKPVAYDVEREELKSRFYMPNKLEWGSDEEEDDSLSREERSERLAIQRRLGKSANSLCSKAKTRHMNQLRNIAAADRGKNISQDYE